MTHNPYNAVIHLGHYNGMFGFFVLWLLYEITVIKCGSIPNVQKSNATQRGISAQNSLVTLSVWMVLSFSVSEWESETIKHTAALRIPNGV